MPVAICVNIKLHIKRPKVYWKIFLEPQAFELIFQPFKAKSYKEMGLSKLSLRPRSLFHNLKRRKCDFSKLVAICVNIKLHIKRLKVYWKIFPELLTLLN